MRLRVKCGFRGRETGTVWNGVAGVFLGIVVIGTGFAQEAPPTRTAEPPAQSPAGVTGIRGGIVAGRLVSRVAPVYPADAKAAGIEGAVVLHGLIGKDGSMHNVTVVSGPEGLRQAAIDAASQWVYQPYLLNGEPTEVATTVTVNFTLGNQHLPKPLFVSEGVMAGLLLKRVEPVFQLGMTPAGLNGTVMLRVVVGVDGSVTSASVTTGPPTLRDPVVAAVKQWTYRPYLVNGVPVAVETTVRVDIDTAR